MAQILSFLSAKGGSGKTVTCASLATFLSGLGIKVLVVDTDAATNGMTLLFLEFLLNKRREKKIRANQGLFEVEAGDIPTAIEIKKNLYLIPAAFRLKNTETISPLQVKRALRSAIGNFSSFDVIMLDAQAGTDAYAQMAAQFGGTDILVSEYDPVSAQGLDRLKIVFSEELRPETTYTLFNKVLPEFAKVIGDGLSIARYLPPIPWDADVVRAFSRRDLAVNLDVPNPYTLSIAQLASSVLQDVAGNNVEAWQRERLNDTVTPIKHKLKELSEARLKLIAKEAPKFEIGMAFAGILGITISIGTIVWQTMKEFRLDYIRYITIEDIPLLAIIVFVPFLFISFNRFEHYLRERKDTTVLDDEIEKLTASLESMESLYKFSAGGTYSNLRRNVGADDHDPAG